MRIIISGLVLSILASCTAAKVSVPEQFSSEASKMHVKGLNGWMINQKLTYLDLISTILRSLFPAFVTKIAESPSRV